MFNKRSIALEIGHSKYPAHTAFAEDKDILTR